MLTNEILDKMSLPELIRLVRVVSHLKQKEKHPKNSGEYHRDRDGLDDLERQFIKDREYVNCFLCTDGTVFISRDKRRVLVKFYSNDRVLLERINRIFVYYGLTHNLKNYTRVKYLRKDGKETINYCLGLGSTESQRVLEFVGELLIKNDKRVLGLAWEPKNHLTAFDKTELSPYEQDSQNYPVTTERSVYT